MSAVVHGGADPGELRELGLDPARVLDLSVNTNPYGPWPAMVEAIAGATIDRYPDPSARLAREALAAHHGVQPDELALGNGAADLLWTLARALPRDHRPALIAAPTFGELPAALTAAGAPVVAWTARAHDGFAIDLDALGTIDASLVYLCTPGTPTGVALPAAAIGAWAEARPTTTVIVDQSFLSLSERAADAAVAMPGNVVRVRSLTKDHAIPGVRVGYLLARRALVARVEAHRPAWTTGAHAQAAAIASARPEGDAFVASSRARLLADRAALDADLRRLGLAPVPSSTGFTLVEVGDAAALRQRLLVHHHVLVRDATSFGLPGFVRIAARPAAERARLVTALRQELA